MWGGFGVFHGVLEWGENPGSEILDLFRSRGFLGILIVAHKLGNRFDKLRNGFNELCEGCYPGWDCCHESDEFCGSHSVLPPLCCCTTIIP